ncbi:MAG: peptidase M48 [Desulfuromonas sp.]|nr:MAG: peptidase M48 [Desulfuromonas sp.]
MTARYTWLLAVPLLALLLAGCQALELASQLGTAVAVSQGALTQSQADSINTSAGAVSKAFTDITPEQEYYIGRAVGAKVLAGYRPYDKARVNRYLNLIGQSLARYSERPETFGGYHFLALDSDEINAFAAPGGLIFISRGLLRCCPDEDAVAAVLAHEIGHVEYQHGLQAIKKSRLTSALAIIGTESVKQLGGTDLARLTETFEESIQDITSTLVNNGYARHLEKEADQSALALLPRAGYDPAALASMLKEMEKRLKPGGPDFARTHPAPSARLAEFADLNKQRSALPAERQQRFTVALRGI